MTNADLARAAYEVIVRLQPKLMTMLRRTCAPDHEEAWSQVVVERAPRVYETYDESTGVPIDAYFMRTMWFYARKWAGKTYRADRPESIDEMFDDRALAEKLEEPTNKAADAAREQLDELMSCLSDYDKWIVRKHAIEGYTFEELTGSLKCSRSAICARYNAAMTTMKVAADRVSKEEV